MQSFRSLGSPSDGGSSSVSGLSAFTPATYDVWCTVALIPVLGDLLNLFLNYWLIVAKAQKLEYVASAPTYTKRTTC